MMAIQAYHRYDETSEKFMTNTRQRAFLELSAQFDDERKARELELLRRDNALKVSEMRGQRLRQQLILAAALFIACICAALLWAFARVSKANEKLRFSSEHDPLTGLSNRRYFNERVLAVDGEKYAARSGDACCWRISITSNASMIPTDTRPATPFWRP